MTSKTYIFSTVLLLLTTINGFGQTKKLIRVDAPNKQTTIELATNKQGKLQYRVFYSGQEIVTWSELGLQANGEAVEKITEIKGIEQRRCNEKFAWPLGENDTVTNNYNELKFSCASFLLQYNLVVRVYDGSVAFRYEILQRAGSHNNSITKENTTFNFTNSFTCYQYNQESVFTPVAIDTLSKSSDFPTTLNIGKFFVSIGEADNKNYTKAELIKGNAPNSLAITFVRDKEVKMDDAFQTPWRTISISKTAIGLHDYSELYLKLAANPLKEVPVWIKPGKLIRAQLNTQSGLECIDFATKHNFQYILFDAGWYGAEFRSTSDPTQVIPQIDMPKVIQYGKDKGIGIILYVNYVGLRTKLDTILPLYKKWGVSGFKFGFVDG
ncbi:MAG TPA: glycoside hydrolase family 97 N-terminal domain-containing protein, partial [Paludibacter sp.]|nr:glycoside hydrolase family 97 N-terminal domain-containing protein [Paludibacter sp.]